MFQGQEALITLAVDAVAKAPQQSAPFEILYLAIAALCATHPAHRREAGRELDTILASSPKLQERAAFKRSAITDALHQALTLRLGDARRAGVLADIGVRAYYDGFGSWIASSHDGPLADIVDLELRAYALALDDLLSVAPAYAIPSRPLPSPRPNRS